MSVYDDYVAWYHRTSGTPDQYPPPQQFLINCGENYSMKEISSFLNENPKWGERYMHAIEEYIQQRKMELIGKWAEE